METEKKFWMKQFFQAYHDAEYWKKLSVLLSLLFMLSVFINMYFIHMYC